jgi:Zinc finger, C3HC4 type (RING finger)
MSYDEEAPPLSLDEPFFSPANFQDAEETRPGMASSEAFGGGGNAVRTIVGQCMNRHLNELVPHGSPALTGSSNSNWRKRIREMMVKQNEEVLGFLQKPVSEHPTFGPVETAMRRFVMRNDVDSRAVPVLKDVLNESLTIAKFQEELSTELTKFGPSSITELQRQSSALLGIYKDIGEKLVDAENRLKLQMEKMDRLIARVASIMELNTNSALPRVVDALEDYLKLAFRDFHIESLYKEVLVLYQKHVVLREAIQVLRVGGTGQTDPLCAICLQESVCHVNVPCGHTFCAGCSRRQGLTCSMCRTNVKERVKLFFS